jgi:putative FmdB family regulatory protein
MPLYEYRCKACGKKTEDLVLAGDAADYVPECAHCGSGDLARLLSTFAAHGGDKGAASLDAPCGMGACESGDMSSCGMGGCGMGGGDFDLN